MLKRFWISLPSFSLTSASGFRKIIVNLELEESNDYHIDDRSPHLRFDSRLDN